MENTNDIITLIFSGLIFTIFIALIYFAIWQIMMKITRSRCQNWCDDKLFNVYQSTSNRQRWTFAIIFFIFTGPIISIFLFFALKNIHLKYETELTRRQFRFTPIY